MWEPEIPCSFSHELPDTFSLPKHFFIDLSRPDKKRLECKPCQCREEMHRYNKSREQFRRLDIQWKLHGKRNENAGKGKDHQHKIKYRFTFAFQCSCKKIKDNGRNKSCQYADGKYANR